MSEYRNYDDDFIYESSDYDKHMSAMTGEKLHSKSDIAAELAYRDYLIKQLKQENEELKNQKHYYKVTYMGNVLNVFFSEEKAKSYNDSFGGVYSIEQIGFN